MSAAPAARSAPTKSIVDAPSESNSGPGPCSPGSPPTGAIASRDRSAPIESAAAASAGADLYASEPSPDLCSSKP